MKPATDAMLGRRSDRRGIAALVAAIAAVTGSACSFLIDGSATASGHCASDADCPTGEACSASTSTCQVATDASDAEPVFPAEASGDSAPEPDVISTSESQCGADGSCLPGQQCIASALPCQSIPDAGIDADSSVTGDADSSVTGDADGGANGEAAAYPSDAASCGASVAVCPDGGCSPALVLFGGRDVNNKDYGDTWLWDGKSWTEATDAGPSPRVYAGMATECGSVLLYGGQDDSSLGTYFGDLWAWVNGAWVPSVADAGPGGRAEFAFGKFNQSTVLFGGVGDIAGGEALGDMWTWSGSAWAEPYLVRYPPARMGPTFGWAGGSFVMFGGLDVNSEPLSDTWLWTGGTDWTSPLGSTEDGGAPSARFFAAGSTLNGSLVLFGGTDGMGDTYSDTWIWNGGVWTGPVRSAHSPSPRDSAAIATLGDRVVLFGGEDPGSNPLGDTWIWDGTDWTDAGVVGPSPRTGASMAAISQ